MRTTAGATMMVNGFKTAFDTGATAGQRFSSILSALMGTMTMINGVMSFYNTLTAL